MAPLSRRRLLVAGGVGLAALAGCTVDGAFGGNGSGSATPGRARDATLARWLETRRAPYFIGHRGAGDVAPEHSLPSYLQALDWGAEAIEVSVVMSSDGVLFCHHDLTLDRTSPLSGRANDHPAHVLDRTPVQVPWLGPYWTGAAMPTLPRLEAVLDQIGGRAVLCIEPKLDAAYPTLVETITRRGLASSVMLKLDASSPRIAMAKEAGFAVFGYLGNMDVATPRAITLLAQALDPRTDAIVLPSRSVKGLLPPDVVAHAVATGIPVWLFPVHRRYEVDYFTGLGAQGMVTPDLGYVNGSLPADSTDRWRAGRISAGELTIDPYSSRFGLQWPGEGVVGLAFPDRPSFLLLGNTNPLPQPSYRLSIDVCYDPLPADRWQHISIAFGHADDRYYEHRMGESDGYHAILRADGQMGIFAHTAGDRDGEALTESVLTGSLAPGTWSRLTLTVGPDGITWSRDNGTSVRSGDSRFRGGYVHIGSSASDGRLLIRNLTVS